MTLPETLPVMALPACSLFPGARLPLFIFEPRYRQMLAEVLEGDRLFCVGTIAGNPDAEPLDIHEFSTAGLVRACVGNDDGTSHLVLEGLQRVRFTGWRHTKPYKIAEIEVVASDNPDPAATSLLCDEIKRLAEGRLRRAGYESDETVQALWETLGSDEAVADFVAYHLVPDVERRQPLLAMPSVVERLVLLGEILGA